MVDRWNVNKLTVARTKMEGGKLQIESCNDEVGAIIKPSGGECKED